MSRTLVRVFLLVLVLVAGVSSFPPEASAQLTGPTSWTSSAFTFDVVTASLTSTTSSVQTVTVQAPNSRNWYQTRIVACSRTSVQPTPARFSTTPTGCRIINDRPSVTAVTLNSNITLTATEISNGGVVVLIAAWQGSTSVFFYSKWVPILTPAIDVDPSTALNLTEEGATGTYNVKLRTQPSGSVKVRVVSGNTAVTVNAGATADTDFTTTNWNTTQAVTVTAVNDSNLIDEMVTLTFSTVNASTSADYDNVADVTRTVNVYDNDRSPGFVTSAVSGTITEAGGSATFTVKLNTRPSTGLTTILRSGNEREGVLRPTNFNWTPSNWNTERTVTVTGVNDDVDDGDQTYNISISYSLGASEYSGITKNVSVTTIDDDVAGITTGAVTGSLTEAGGTATFTVVLDSEPTADVTIAVSSGDPTEGTVLPASLTFTAGNWNTSKMVTVIGADDNLDDGPVTWAVRVTPSSSDPKYNTPLLSHVDVDVTTTDDDTPGLKIDPIELALEEATTNPATHMKTYTVKLASEPTAAVTVTVTNGDTGVVTVAPTTLIFMDADWATAQTVTVTAAVDDDYLHDPPVMLTHMVSSLDTDYVSPSADVWGTVTVTVEDEEPPPLGAGTNMARYNGVEVTLRAPDAPGVTVTPPRTVSGAGLQAIEIEIALEADPPAVAADGSVQGLALFSLGPAGARTVFEITVQLPDSDTALTAAQLAALLPGEGIKICLPVNDELREVVAKVDKPLQFLHYQDDAWRVEPPVEGPPDKVCARLKTFSPVALAFENLKPAFPKEHKGLKKEYPTGQAVTEGEGALPRAAGGNLPLRYRLEPPALPAGLTYKASEEGDNPGLTIIGTPTTPTAAQPYMLIATDKNDDEAKLPFTIEIKPGIQSRDLGLVLAGVGRTLASDAVEILGGRFGYAPASRLQVTLGGQVLRLTNPPASPSPSSPSPLAGEGRGEGGILRGEGSLLQGEATRAVPAGSPSPWQQATGLALGVARAFGVTINTPSPHSPSPLAGEGRGEGGILQSEGGFLQNETSRLGRLPTDLRRTTTASPLGLQPVSGKDLLARSAFELPLTRTGDDGVPAWTLWGRGSAAGFSGQPEAGFTMDGTLYSGYVGVDYRPQATMLLGLALAHSTGDVNYEREATKAGADVELTSVLPYAHWQPRPGLGVWGLAGVGWGEMDLKLVGDPQTYTTGLTSWLGAVGGRQALTTWQWIDLAAKTDAFLTTVRSAGKTNLPAARGHAQRVRLVVEGRTAVDLSPVSRLEPRLELGGPVGQRHRGARPRLRVGWWRRLHADGLGIERGRARAVSAAARGRSV